VAVLEPVVQEPVIQEPLTTELPALDNASTDVSVTADDVESGTPEESGEGAEAAVAEADSSADQANSTEGSALFILTGNDSGPTAGSALEQGLSAAQQTLQSWAASTSAASDVTSLFAPKDSSTGSAESRTLQALQDIGTGEAAVAVELRDHENLLGALGAFAASGPAGTAIIFLNRDWVQSHGVSSEAIQTVLLEEYGHYLDNVLNEGQDTAGDEGEAFAAKLLNRDLTSTKLEQIANEQDQTHILIDGMLVNVEKSQITFSAVYQGTPSSLSEEAQSLQNIQLLVGSNFTFTSSNPSDTYFSGNNVTGTISYNDGNGQQTLYGVASRLFKTGNTVDGIYFYAPGTDGAIGTGDTGEAAYLMMINPVFTTGATYGTSSDPVDTALNNLLVAYQAPTAYEDSSTSPGAQPAIEQGVTTAGQNATGNVLTNDTGSAARTVTGAGTSSAGTPVTAGTTGADLAGGTEITGVYGKLYIAADGTYRYEVDNGDPAVDALLDVNSTLTERFTYEITDAGLNTDTATLTVTIQGANDAPVATNDFNSAKESLRTDATAYDSTDPLGTRATGNVLSNDSDVDSTSYGETEGVLGFFGEGDYVSYTPGAAITSMTFAASQNLSSVAGGEYVYLKIGTTYYLLKEGTTAISVDTNTTNADGTYNIALTGDSDNYTVSDGSQVAFWQQSGTPDDSFTSIGGKKLATVSTSTSLTTSDVTINNLTGTPAVGMSLTGTNIPEGATITAVNDNLDGSYTLTVDVQITTAPSGLIEFSGAAGSLITGQYGTLQLDADGGYIYTPFANNASLAAGQVENDIFEYTMVDSDGATSVATLTIAVTGSAATDPNARDDTNLSGAIEAGGAANTGGATASGSVLTNDTTPSGTNAVVGGRAAAGTTEQVIASASYEDIEGAHGTLRLYANGNYVYTVRDTDANVQALNAGDTLDDVFSYRIRNTAGGEDVATLTITVNGANDHPLANEDTLGATEDTPVTFSASDLLSNDTDVDSTGLTIQSVTSGTGGTVVLNGDGTVTFTPTANFTGTATFSYVMNDGTSPTSGTSTANVTINVAAVNDAPLAKDNHYGTLKNTELSGVNVLTDNDATHGLDSDPEDNTLSISKVNGQLFTANSTHGTYTAALGWMEVALNHGTLYIQADGNTVYQPANDVIAGDNFSYVATDGQDESAAALVTFTVTDPSNTPAVISGDAVGAVTEDLNVSAGNLTDTGSLSVTDPDAGEASFLTGAAD
ncbi:tandem-95 repeat protein, partial [Hydrogenophaga bisanensis]